ncbi:MAG: STAS domain-containing protein [Magnetococcus sp. DMHC-6]
MGITVSKSHNTITIKLPERFDYQSRNEFVNSYKTSPANTIFIIDFSDVLFLDSSALGLLLLFRDVVSKKQGNENESHKIENIIFMNCQPKILRLFQMSQFTEIFNIL